MGDHGLDYWAHGPARPAEARIADATKADLVLEHQAQRALCVEAR